MAVTGNSFPTVLGIEVVKELPCQVLNQFAHLLRLPFVLALVVVHVIAISVQQLANSFSFSVDLFHAVTSASSRRMSCSIVLISALISSSGRGGVYL